MAPAFLKKDGEFATLALDALAINHLFGFARRVLDEVSKDWLDLLAVNLFKKCL